MLDLHSAERGVTKLESRESCHPTERQCPLTESPISRSKCGFSSDQAKVIAGDIAHFEADSGPEKAK